ncbi:MAG: hypothetical protein QM605_16560 [Sphingobium sp.]
MKTIAASLSASALILSLSLATFAGAQQQDHRPPIVEGKERPLLLARMVVEATPLPKQAD